VPAASGLLQNYPNPFNPATTLSFDAGGNGRVFLAVYSLRGKLVRTLVDRVLEAGRHQVVWDGRDDRGEQVPSGIYISSLRTGSFMETRKLLLLR
jgi:flagellar hook assembly protein FlgD